MCRRGLVAFQLRKTPQLFCVLCVAMASIVKPLLVKFLSWKKKWPAVDVRTAGQ
jgi:hypothetical protein